MRKDRREFLKVSVAASAATLVPDTISSDTTVAGGEVKNAGAFGVLVDTVLCVGCRQCERACHKANGICEKDPESFSDRTLLESPRRPDECAYTVVNRIAGTDPKYWMKMQCMHCNEPACASACIVGALTKDNRGPVVYDAWKCIGCRYCFLACPFDIPAYEYGNALNPQVRKCTFCYQRFGESEFQPACVSVCPGGALTFGTREELIDLALLRMKRAPDKYVDDIYGRHEVGGTSWMYLAGVDFASTSLPRVGSQPISALTEKIQHGVFKSFVPPLVLYGLLGLIMHSLRENKQEVRENNEQQI
ncbi:MAG: 4Fe-4S dicluster domain-containing protein [Candidatus Zixiibacteriota bacterium]|nr:MAG: 4Fe-4S dicluster domain-containing protein [candidate division Zixibacteria bacterium]